jgi:peptidoglycan hydrolase CwlO-like protein
MSTEIQAFLIALAIATIPNLIIKWVENRIPQENLGKTAIEAADISFDMLKETILSQKESIDFLQKRLEFRRNEAKRVEEENEALCLENDTLHNEIKKLRQRIRDLEDKGE